MIWVDCDGVLADFNAEYLHQLWVVTGRYHTREEITDFEFSKCVASPEEDEMVWRRLDQSPGLVATLGEMPGAMEGLAKLRTLGKVGCLTSPHLGPHWMYERAQWLMARGFTKRQIVFASDKSPHTGRILIDDKFENCRDWSVKNNRPAILIDAPHNHHQLSWLRVYRARDLLHAVDIAKNILDLE